MKDTIGPTSEITPAENVRSSDAIEKAFEANERSAPSELSPLNSTDVERTQPLADGTGKFPGPEVFTNSNVTPNKVTNSQIEIVNTNGSVNDAGTWDSVQKIFDGKRRD